MALELRPNCEWCDCDLPPHSPEARICSYECTFCARCVAEILHDVCPNCGGGFAPRPLRPVREWRPGLSLALRPASARRVRASYGAEEVAGFVATLRSLPPSQR